MAYSFKQRSDGGFDFFDSNKKKTNIEAYVKNTGANINALRTNMAAKGDPAQRGRVASGQIKLPNQFQAQFQTPKVNYAQPKPVKKDEGWTPLKNIADFGGGIAKTVGDGLAGGVNFVGETVKGVGNIIDTNVKQQQNQDYYNKRDNYLKQFLGNEQKYLQELNSYNPAVKKVDLNWDKKRQDEANFKKAGQNTYKLAQYLPGVGIGTETMGTLGALIQGDEGDINKGLVNLTQGVEWDKLNDEQKKQTLIQRNLGGALSTLDLIPTAGKTVGGFIKGTVKGGLREGAETAAKSYAKTVGSKTINELLGVGTKQLAKQGAKSAFTGTVMGAGLGVGLNALMGGKDWQSAGFEGAKSGFIGGVIGSPLDINTKNIPVIVNKANEFITSTPPRTPGRVEAYKVKIQAERQPNPNAINNNEAYTISDYADMINPRDRYLKDTSNPATIRGINQLHGQARNAAETAGLDIITGSPIERQNRIIEFMRQRDKFDDGFAKLPLNKKLQDFASRNLDEGKLGKEVDLDTLKSQLTDNRKNIKATDEKLTAEFYRKSKNMTDEQKAVLQKEYQTKFGTSDAKKQEQSIKKSIEDFQQNEVPDSVTSNKVKQIIKESHSQNTANPKSTGYFIDLSPDKIKDVTPLKGIDDYGDSMWVNTKAGISEVRIQDWTESGQGWRVSNDNGNDIATFKTELEAKDFARKALTVENEAKRQGKRVILSGSIVNPSKQVSTPTPQVSKTPLATPVDNTPAVAKQVTQPKVVKTVSKKASEAVPVDRGFVGSVQGAKNVTKKVKSEVAGTYTPKTNDKLMGEAKALLSDGAKIDFKNTKNLDQKVAATIQEALNAQKAGDHVLAANLFNNLSEHGTELGRGVQAFSLLQNMSPESVALSVAGKIKKFNATHNFKKIPELDAGKMKIISDMMSEIDLLKGRDKNIALNELSNTISEFIPSSVADKAIAVWKAGLLTSLRTHERNFVGNAMHSIGEIAKDIPAMLDDKLMSLRTGKRSLTMTLRGMGQFGSKSTRQQMADIITKGYDPSNLVNKFDYKRVTWGKNPIEQTLKKYTDVVFNTLGAEDKPFYNAAMARSLYDQAGAEAINAGKRGNKAFIDNLVKNPTEEMTKIAIGDANTAVFKDKNMVTNAVNGLKQKLGQSELGKVVGEVAMPFTGVPSSIAGQMIAYSPIGLIKGVARSGAVLAGKVPAMQRLAAQEVGRGVIGSGLIGLGAYLTQQGLMTGQPKDSKEAAQWQLEGKQANSIMIGGKWRSINSVGPEALVMLAGSKIAQGKEAGITAANIGKDFTGQTFLQGMSGPINAISDPERYGQSYISNQIASVIPNIVKDTAKAFDPTQRETKGNDLGSTTLNVLQGGIPGLRNQLLPKRDVLGKPMAQEPTGLGAFLDLFNSKTPIKGTVVDELARLNELGLNATPSAVSNSKNKDGVKMTPQELDKLEEYSGGQVTAGIESLVKSDSYKLMSDEQKQNAIGNLVSKIKSQAKTNISSGNTNDISVSAGVASNDLKLTYQQHLDAYNKGVKDGTITGPDVMTKKKTLDKEAITSKYSSEVNDFYKLSKADQQAYFDKDRAGATKLYDQAKLMDAELVGKGLASTKFSTKSSGGTAKKSGGSKSSGTSKANIAKILADMNKAYQNQSTTTKDLNKLLEGTIIKPKNTKVALKAINVKGAK